MCVATLPPSHPLRCSPARRLFTKLCFFQSQRIAWSTVLTEPMDSSAISSKCSAHSLQPKKVRTYLLMVCSTACGSPSKPAVGGADTAGPVGARSRLCAGSPSPGAFPAGRSGLCLEGAAPNTQHALQDVARAGGTPPSRDCEGSGCSASARGGPASPRRCCEWATCMLRRQTPDSRRKEPASHENKDPSHHPKGGGHGAGAHGSLQTTNTGIEPTNKTEIRTD